MSSASPLSARLRSLGVASCLALVAVACGDDDDTTASDDAPPAEGEAADAASSEYCRLAAELDQQDGPPTNEQLEALGAAGPDEIREELDFVVAAFIAADGDFGKVFSDPEVEEKLGAVEEYEADVCGLDEGDGEDETETEAAEGAEIVPVTAVDFEFQGIPAEVPAGPVAFEFTNEGESAHEMAIFKLGEGVDLDELLASEEEPSDEEAQEAGGTFAPPGEGGVYANVDLEPGTYAVVCFIPGPEGKAHHELGMKTTFEVG